MEFEPMQVITSDMSTTNESQHRGHEKYCKIKKKAWMLIKMNVVVLLKFKIM